MPLTRLDNLISSKTGKYLYVSPDDFNATDSLSNRGNSPVTPFKSIQRAFLEIARYSYTPGPSNDRFDQFSIMLMPGIHYIDNRPGLVNTSGINEFDFNEALGAWGEDPILDVSNPDNVLYLFNNTEGGTIIPRGSSLVGYDLRRTTIRPLYVPDPASVTIPRSAIFNVTGGCYFWQFTIKDGQTTAESPLYNPAIGSGEVYYDPTDFTKKAAPNFSHHKLTVFEYADKEELQLYYRKVAKAFSKYQTGIDTISPDGIPEFDYNVQENRIVGPLSDSRVIESLKFTDNSDGLSPGIPASTTEIEVTTKVDHGYFAGQFIAISGTEIDNEIEGFWPIYDISDDPRKFTYRVPFVVSGIGQGLSNRNTYNVGTSPALGQNAQVLAEVDSVESASPYVFNVSIRSVWGICGIWANGLKATGFKSMVIAQYTGVSLQRDDRAFIRYDEYANTWNQASLIDAFATVPYHAKGDSYWKDDWRNFHVRASEDAFIQNVSIFAVGFADHFLMESGGDMSITNSNSNFGNTSLHAIGFKGFSFNQDKAGYITDIIPPQKIVESETNRKKVLYYTIDVQGTIQDPENKTKLFLGGTDLDNPLNRPAATIEGYRVGAKSSDKLFVKLDQKNSISTFETTLEPTGFVKYIAKGSILNPDNFSINNRNVDAANLIASNRRIIQEEVFGYILEKYPRLQNISYVNPGLNPAAGRYFDARNLILNNRQEIIDTAYDQMLEAYPNYDGNGGNTFGAKCKRDIGYIVDAIAEDLRDGGNSNIIEATKFYFTGSGTPISNGLVGEEDPSVFAFKRARDLCKKAIANLLTVQSTIYDPEDPSILSSYGVIAGSTGSAALGYTSEGVTVDDANKQDPAGRYKDSSNLIASNKSDIIDSAINAITTAYPSFTFPGGNDTKCRRDLGFIIDGIAQDLWFGGNEYTIAGVIEYFDGNSLLTNGVSGEVDQTIVALEELKAQINLAITNGLASKDLTITADPTTGSNTDPASCADARSTVDSLIQIFIDSLTNGNLDSLPPVDNGNWDCANVRSSIDTLFDILTDSITTGSLENLPTINTGDFTVNNEASKCFRDVSYIVDAIVNDLRYGGNINSVQAGEAYFVGNQLEYIDGEKAETIDAWNYVGQMAIAAMRNFDFVAYGCGTTANSSLVDVGDTSGILIGMKVEEYTSDSYRDGAGAPGLLKENPADRILVETTIPADTYVKRIVDSTTIELGVKNSRLDSGNAVDAKLTNTIGGSLHLHFAFENGQWADTEPQTVTVGPETEDPDVIQDTTVSISQRECASTASAILQLVDNITTIINTGLTQTVNGIEVPTIDRVEPTFNTALLASRATVFTIDTTGYGSTNAHDFETGTPVRLVPRPRFDVSTGKYVDVDKRLVRLPKGFDTNTIYYVIAPGRTTQPVDYSSTTYFNGSDQTKLMLATSKENAAAGIYIYAAETESIDPDVEIDIYQFVIDDKYDLHTYSCNLINTVVGGIQTDISHIFDKPSTSTTPQKVFFRAIEDNELPNLGGTFAEDPEIAITFGNNAGKINPNVEFFTRYQTSKVFTIHKTLDNALDNVDPIEFAGEGSFRVFANKKRSPMRFDPGFNGTDTDNGKWYLQCKDRITGETDNSIIYKEIFYRIFESDYDSKPTTTDTWYERIDDTREANERTYKLRYVIPKYIENARDPINGFVIKTRTDDTRKLVPQKLLLKPVAGNVYGARFQNPEQTAELIGYTIDDFDADDNLNFENAYDPYRRPKIGDDQGKDYRKIARFNSGIAATIQSGRYVEDSLNSNIKYLELTVFDHAVDTLNFPGLRNEIFTTVKISSPQGGAFVVNKTQKNATNAISFSGNSSGTAYIHGYYSVEGSHYLILKGISGAKGINSLEYSEFQNTRFTQGSVFADMLEDQDMGKSLPLKTHIKKNYPEYYYKQNGSNVYTITPGDRIQDDAGIEYYVYSVEDTGIIEDTFYIFDSKEIQKRIPGQQDGIYYLTALRGNISPYPQGAGIGDNFRNLKFSQPVGKLYPLNYRNDPLWFQKSGTTNEEKNYYSQLIDPPQSFSAADNYIHGKVTINDTKHSVTKELMYDLTKQSAFVENTYTGSNQIEAQLGNATSGSEDRRIPISGDNTVITDQRYYVELRRPSIARAGNHTFEYLGFGPGNYSTGLPARQEIVLEPEEDFYAQSKKQDAGIVFYTGINSQGDLYIGNRRINAITGEETFIDRAVLVDDGDEDDVIGQLVTTFDTPVTFNQNITIVGGPDGELVNNINSPILVNIPDQQLKNQNAPLVVYSLVSSTDPITGLPQDSTLDRNNFFPNTTGDIRLGKNRVDAAIFGFNRKGNGQGYKAQIHAPGGVASNISPNQDTLISCGGTLLNINQYQVYGGTVQQDPNDPCKIIVNGGALPISGDILLKGGSVGKNGSLGWIFANIYIDITNNVISSLEVIVDQNVNIAKFTFIDSNSNEVSIGSLNIKASSEIRLSNINYNGLLNGTWSVINTPTYPYDPTDNIVYFEINPRTGSPIGAFDITWTDLIGDSVNPSPNALVSFSVSNWKEVGILGAEAIRTETETWGDFKLGINTLARASHDAYQNAFVETQNTDPRANLDIVGNAYISGRKMTDWLGEDNYNDRERNRISDAFVVGFEDTGSTNSNDIDAALAALRVSTETIAVTEAGRGNNENKVGINVTDTELDRALVVRGDSRFTEDARFERDIEVNGDGTIGEIRTAITNGTFGIVDETTFTGTLNIANSVNTVNIANGAETVKFADVTTSAQTIDIGNNASTNTISIGNSVAGDQYFYVGNASANSSVWIGNTPDTLTNISKVTIGGAYNNNETLSYTQIDSKSLKISGDVQLGTRRGITDFVNLTSTAGTVNFFSGNSNTNVLEFATNASSITIAGQGGSTKIRNSLVVDASAIFNSSMTLCGGYASFSFTAQRQRSGSDLIEHTTGILGNNQFNNNVDIITVNRVSTDDARYNEIDTAASGNWGGIGYQNARTNVGGTPEVEPQNLPALSGNQYYLPIKNAPFDEDGNAYFLENDYLLIDSPEGAGSFTEIEDFSTYDVGNNPVNYSFISDFENTSIDASGSGTGSAGGFDTNQNYIHFSSDNTSSRWVTFTAVDASFYQSAGPISKIAINVYIGNDQNGGELPDATDEGLKLRYSLDNGSSWILIDDIAPTDLDDRDPSSWPTFVQWNDETKNYAKLSLDIPVDAQRANVQFQIYQQVTTTVDNYGITSVEYFVSTPGGTHVEFVRVVSTPRTNYSPYLLVVEREPFGTFTGVRNDHPDATAIYKCNVQFDSTWTVQPIDSDGNIENIYLSEFGGTIDNGDYVIISRESSQPENEPVLYDKGEVFKVLTPLSLVPKEFTISSNCEDGDSADVFVVNSVTGNTKIGGDLTVNQSVIIDGGCDTTDLGTITGNLVPVDGNVYTFYIEGINSTDIAKVSLGDIVKFNTVNGVNALLIPGSKVTEIDSDKIKLSSAILTTAQINNVSFRLVRNEEFIITNGKDQNTLHFDTCLANLELGNQFRRLDISRVYPTTETVSATVSRYEDITDNIRVYSYWTDPQIINSGGPTTTLTANATTGVIPGSVYLSVASLGVGSGRFAVGDLIIVGQTTDIAGNLLVDNDFEFMEVAGVDTGTNTLRCLPGREGTTANPLSTYLSTTTSVIRILKHPESSPLVDIEARQRTTGGVTTNFVSAILEYGHIVQTKLDYQNWIRFEDLTGTLSDQLFFVNSGLLGKYHEENMDESVQDGNSTHRNGSLTLNHNFNMIGGDILIKDSVNKTTIVRVKNDDGHADHSGSIEFDAGIIGRGDLKIYPVSCPENVLQDSTGCNLSFGVDIFGDAEIGNSLYIRTSPAEIPAKSPRLHIDNLGNNGANDFIINHDQSIDSFGITNFYTRTGGRHSRYVSSGSDDDQKNLSPNVVYFVNVDDQDALVLNLPTNAITGDRIEIIEVGGNLGYDTSLVIRAATNVRVQGDSTGTTIGIGGSTPYNGGELVVQTPNAAFTLIYLGGIDSQGTIVSSGVTGWWLKEV